MAMYTYGLPSSCSLSCCVPWCSAACAVVWPVPQDPKSKVREAFEGGKDGAGEGEGEDKKQTGRNSKAEIAKKPYQLLMVSDALHTDHAVST